MRRALLLASGLLAAALLLGGNVQQVVGSIVATACTNQFVRSLVASGAATCAAVSLTSDVTGTLPAGNGGTGNTGGAWTTATPAVTCTSGSGTITAAAHYLAEGKKITWNAVITITAIGTCTGSLTVALPVAALQGAPFAGVNLSSNTSVIGSVGGGGSGVSVASYSGSAPGTTGQFLVVGGIYEST